MAVGPAYFSASFLLGPKQAFSVQIAAVVCSGLDPDQGV